MKQTQVLTPVAHVNGWFLSVYTSYKSQNFRLFVESNLSVLNFRIFLLMYLGSQSSLGPWESRLVEPERRRRSTPIQLTDNSHDQELQPFPRWGRRLASFPLGEDTIWLLTVEIDLLLFTLGNNG